MQNVAGSIFQRLQHVMFLVTLVQNDFLSNEQNEGRSNFELPLQSAHEMMENVTKKKTKPGVK